MRSTGTKNKSRAKVVCDSWQAAENAARDGTLSANRGAEIINEMLRRLGQEPVARIKLCDWLKDWLESKVDAVSKGNYQRYQYAATQFLEFLGQDSNRMLLESVNESHIRGFAKKLKSEGRSGPTVNKIVRGDLGNAFNRAVKLGKITHNPVHGVAAEKDPDRKPRMKFTPEQIAKLVAAANSDDWVGAILMGYTTGARLYDVTNLKWDSIDLNVGVIAFTQKKTERRTGKETVVGIHPDFDGWLLRHVSDDPRAAVFPTLAGRTDSGRGGLSNEFIAIVERAGIKQPLLRERKGKHSRSLKGLTYHSLRHTAASAAFNAAAKESARRITGHAERGSLERYLHADIDAIKSATALIPRLPQRN
jgi:integrase